MSIAIVIPAADEAAVIGRCLDAIDAAASRLRTEAGPLPVRVVVVLDGCRDRTGEIVRARPEVIAVETSYRNVGAARAAGAERALAGRPGDTVLASTDADSMVPIDWLVELHRRLRRTDLVLGTVVPDDTLHDAARDAWFAQHDLVDGHPYVHGANLAITARAYRALGGWRPLPTGEDEELVMRARAAGMRVHSTAALPVLTSARVSGRVPHGFSTYVADLVDPARQIATP